jgi:hypothetical protein
MRRHDTKKAKQDKNKTKTRQKQDKNKTPKDNTGDNTETSAGGGFSGSYLWIVSCQQTYYVRYTFEDNQTVVLTTRYSETIQERTKGAQTTNDYI